jgi:UDP-3-O-[3-hydroxymyristoyl] N-acetylglucosamine deacetylase/3-hydroxyacyl-[acyl-carrier-protein] dehydratase
MNVKQRTIKTEISVTGVGLHTGHLATMTFKPAPENHGYKFKRIDLPGEPIIDADVDNVTDTSRGTTISQNGASVNTVEHVLASLVGTEVDNVIIEIDGPEIPIMDGSSIMFVEALEKAGVTSLDIVGQEYSVGLQVEAINLEDFGPEDVLVIDEVLKPLLVYKGKSQETIKLLQLGRVVLKRKGE